MTLHTTITGVVLAGGKSKRLGQDKARVVVGDKDLLARTVDVMKQVFSSVIVVGRDAGEHGLDVPWVLDDYPGKGPAGGIYTAIGVSGSPCCVVSCDLPRLAPEMLLELIHARNKEVYSKLMTTYYQIETGYIESLVSIYEVEARPRIKQFMDAECFKLSAIFPPDLRTHIPYSIEDAEMFFNVNFPHDLEKLRAGVRSL